MERSGDHRRQRHLELVGERADQRHHEQRDAQPGRVPHIGEARAQLALLVRHRLGRAVVDAVRGAAVHREVGAHHGQEAGGVEREARTHAEPRDEHAADRGADGARHVHDDGVQSDGVAHQTARHHLAHERLTCRVVEGGHETQQHREHEDPRERDVVAEGEHCQHERQHRCGELGPDEQPTLVDAIDDDARVRSEQQHGQRLHRDVEPEPGRRAGQLQHQPGQCHRLHPGARQRHGLAQEELAVVRDRERRERGFLVVARCRSGRCFVAVVAEGGGIRRLRGHRFHRRIRAQDPLAPVRG